MIIDNNKQMVISCDRSPSNSKDKFMIMLQIDEACSGDFRLHLKCLVLILVDLKYNYYKKEEKFNV